MTTVNGIKQLQPPRPVCITCNYFGRKPIGGVRDTLVDDSCWGLEEVEKNGCIHHPDYDEVKK